MNSEHEQAFTEFVTTASPRLLAFAQLLVGEVDPEQPVPPAGTRDPS